MHTLHLYPGCFTKKKNEQQGTHLPAKELKNISVFQCRRNAMFVECGYGYKIIHYGSLKQNMDGASQKNR